MKRNMEMAMSSLWWHRSGTVKRLHRLAAALVVDIVLEVDVVASTDSAAPALELGVVASSARR